MLKIFKLITSALGNVHTVNGHVENAYELWTSFYRMVSNLGATAAEPAPVAVAEQAVADEAPAAEPAEVKAAIPAL